MRLLICHLAWLFVAGSALAVPVPLASYEGQPVAGLGARADLGSFGAKDSYGELSAVSVLCFLEGCPKGLAPVVFSGPLFWPLVSASPEKGVLKGLPEALATFRADGKRVIVGVDLPASLAAFGARLPERYERTALGWRRWSLTDSDGRGAPTWDGPFSEWLLDSLEAELAVVKGHSETAYEAIAGFSVAYSLEAEALEQLDYNPRYLSLWQSDWLPRYYTLEELGRQWFDDSSHYIDWNQVAPIMASTEADYTSDGARLAWRDWRAFLCETRLRALEEFAKELRRIAPGKLVTLELEGPYMTAVAPDGSLALQGEGILEAFDALSLNFAPEPNGALALRPEALRAWLTLMARVAREAGIALWVSRLAISGDRPELLSKALDACQSAGASLVAVHFFDRSARATRSEEQYRLQRGDSGFQLVERLVSSRPGWNPLSEPREASLGIVYDTRGDTKSVWEVCQWLTQAGVDFDLLLSGQIQSAGGLERRALLLPDGALPPPKTWLDGQLLPWLRQGGVLIALGDSLSLPGSGPEVELVSPATPVVLVVPRKALPGLEQELRVTGFSAVISVEAGPCTLAEWQPGGGAGLLKRSFGAGTVLWAGIRFTQPGGQSGLLTTNPSGQALLEALGLEVKALVQD